MTVESSQARQQILETASELFFFIKREFSTWGLTK